MKIIMKNMETIKQITSIVTGIAGLLIILNFLVVPLYNRINYQMPSEILQIKNEMGNIRSDIKTEMENLRTEMGIIRSDIGNIRSDIRSINHRIDKSFELHTKLDQ